MTIPTGTANDILKKMFNNTAIPWDSITDIYVSLHTADPTVTGNQQSSEATYSNYLRLHLERTNVGWTVTNNTMVNAQALQFATCGVTGNTIQYVGLGTLDTGNAGQLITYGQLNTPIPVSNLITPLFNASALTVTVT